MYDTETDDLVSRNIISKQHQNSVLYLNGHSGAISRQHYIKKKKDDAVKDGRHVMNLLLNGGIDRESSVDDASRGGKQDDDGVRYSEGDYDVDEQDSFHYEDNNDMFHPFEYEQAEKLTDDSGHYGSDQDKEPGNERYIITERGIGDDGPFSNSGRVNYRVNVCDSDSDSAHNAYGYDANERYSSSIGRGGGRGGNSRHWRHDHTDDWDDTWDDTVTGLEMRSNGRRYRYDNHMILQENRENQDKKHPAYVSSDKSRGQSKNSEHSYFSSPRRNDDFFRGAGSNVANESTKSSTSIRRSMGDRYQCTRNNDAITDEIEILRPLPLRVDTPKEAYVTWTEAEKEYTQKAYDIIYAQLPHEQKRFIAREILNHIRNDPSARKIFHPSHLESSGKFRHCIREYVNK